MSSQSRECPYCFEQIQTQAIKCPHCGEYQHDSAKAELSTLKFRYYNRGIATVLSTVLPGAGQIFQGRLLPGFVFLLLSQTFHLTMFNIPLVRSWTSYLYERLTRGTGGASFILVSLLSLLFYILNVVDAYRQIPILEVPQVKSVSVPDQESYSSSS